MRCIVISHHRKRDGKTQNIFCLDCPWHVSITDTSETIASLVRKDMDLLHYLSMSVLWDWTDSKGTFILYMNSNARVGSHRN